MTSTRRTFSPTIGIAAIGLVLMLVAAGCGSSESVDAETSPNGTEAPQSDGEEQTSSEDGGEPEAEESTTDATATLTLSDGTVYNLDLDTCDTADTNPSVVPLAGGYDIEGETPDGFALTVARLGFDGEVAISGGALEADLDSGDLIYAIVNDSLALSVDGGSVTGTFSLRAIAPNRPHGAEVDATFVASC